MAPVRDVERLRRVQAADGLPAEAATPLPSLTHEWPADLAFDAAIHCAGALFERTLEDYLRTNVLWSLAVLSKAAPRPCVVLSSQSAGGPTPSGRLARREEDPDEPVSWYGESKLRLERAIWRRFHGSPIAVLRPPMVLGPRDAALRQLFRAARGLVVPKPGLRPKWFSFVGVEDLVRAVFVALEAAGELAGQPFYVASRQIICDRTLLTEAAQMQNRRAWLVPLPHPALALVAQMVDAMPALRRSLPSLTRDRVREIFPDRWVVDPSAFEEAAGWRARETLAGALQAFWDHESARQAGMAAAPAALTSP